MRLYPVVGLLALGFALGAGCSSDSEGGDGAGGSTSDASTTGGSGGSIAGTGGSAATGGSSTTGGSSGTSATGGAGGSPAAQCALDSDCTAPLVCLGGACVECNPTLCQGHGPYACGNCTDDDGDGLTDMGDPDCLGPCHDQEDGYMGCISGQKNQPCINDCYFDYDSGSGNDGCSWDHRCDPYGTDGSEGTECPYTCDACSGDKATCIESCTDTPPSLAGTCAEMYNTQSDACETYCGPLTPNGCDCFGCCELPAHSGQYVFLGSTSDLSTQCVQGTCTKEAAEAGDLTACRPCVPVAACLNKCETCECCLGGDCNNLPEECRPDAGTDSGTPTCIPPQCPTGVQPCGVECTPACAEGFFCSTGCCQKSPA
jgi:hypothetical protein